MLAPCLLVVVLGQTNQTELLHFTASWCQACQESKPAVQQLESSGFPIRHFDIDQHPDMARRYQVQSIPSFVLVSNGRVVNRIDRGVSYRDLARLVQKAPRSPQQRSQASPRHSLEPTQQRPSDNRTSPAQQAAMVATVRLRVEDPKGHSFGTGTIVDVHNQEALVLTCAHIFSDSRGRGTIHIDQIAGQQKAKGRLLRADSKNDLALVTFQTDAEIQPVQVARHRTAVRKGDRVFSVGCNRGNNPTFMHGRVKAIDKYIGPPSNLIVSGTPVDGRSGGGLFTADGQLIGVCQNADPELREGIYGHVPSIHQHFDRAKLSFVYNRTTQPPRIHNSEPDRIAASGSTRIPLIQRDDRSIAPASLSRVGQTIKQRDLEVVCIVRSKRNPSQKSQVVILDQPSSDFLELLSNEQSFQRSRQSTKLRVSRR